MDKQDQSQKPNDEELFDKVVEENDDNGVAVPVRSGTAETPAYAEVPAIDSEPATSAAVAPVTQPAPQPQQPVAPAAPVTVPTAAPGVKHGTGGGTLVLQWISYAFWGWFAASMTYLAGVTFAYFINGQIDGSIGESLAYPLASAIVMLIAALVADMLYARHEPEHKTGGSNVILLFHTVIYILVSVSALIFAVFSLLSMFLDDSSTSGKQIALWTALTASVLFGVIVVRMTLAGRRPVMRKAFWGGMIVLALVMITVSLVGPATYATKTRDDRLIERALPELARSINDYATTNNKLPGSLDDVRVGVTSYYRGDVEKLLDKKLVTYKPNIEPAVTTEQSFSFDSKSIVTKTNDFAPSESPIESTFYYQLCVTYQAESKNGGYDSEPYDASSKYQTTPSTYRHAKGEVCYDLSTRYTY